MAALARWCVQRRLVTVLLWLLALGGVATAATVAGSAYSNDYGIPGTGSDRASRLLESRFPDLGGDSDTIVWHTTSGTVRAADVEQAMTRTLDRIADLPGVAAVSNPYHDADSPLISENADTAYATVTFEDASQDLDPGQARAVVDTAEAAETGGLRIELGGGAIALTESGGSHLAEAVGVAVAAVVLFLAFGSVAAALLPIATALVSVGTAYAGITLLGHAMTVADFAPMLGTLIGLGVGIDYALFIVTRHRRGLKRGLSVADAAADAVATTGRAVVFAGATVCIALLGMLILRLSFLNGVAVAASLTVLLTVAASVTLLPALLSYIGPRALSRRERRRLAEHGPEPEVPTGFAARWSAFVERRPKLLGALALVVITVVALPTLGLRLGTSDQGNDPQGTTTRQAYDLLADGFGPGVNGPLTLVTEVRGAEDRLALDNLDATLRTTEGVSSVTPVMYNSGGDAAYLTVVPESAPQSEDTSDLVERLRSEVLPRAEAGTALDVHVGGVTAGYDDFADVIVGKLPSSSASSSASAASCSCWPSGPSASPQGRRHERGRGGRRLRRGRGDLPVGLGKRAARPRQRGAHRTLPARDHGLGALRALHGLPGLPRQPDVRGVAGDRRQPPGRPGWARRDRPRDQLRRRHHDLGLPRLRPQRRPGDRHVRHRAGRRGRPGRLRAAHPPGARPDAPARPRQLVAAAPPGRPPAAHQHRAARVPGRP